MKSCLAFLVMMFAPVLAKAQELDVVALRALFYAAADDKAAAQQFADTLAHVDETSPPVQLGYKGMAHFMTCHHALNPYAKVKYFLLGKAALEKAITLAPENLELRYLRFTVQTNVPAFLGYTRNVLEDKNFILTALKAGAENAVAADLRARILDYMLRNEYCSAKERSELEILQKNLEKE